ncbi:MAG: amidase [Rhizobiales bacterium]|nr:amidase [Hyphomicrobiales bacterium]
MAKFDIATLTATKAATEIARGALSAEEYTHICLDQIAAVEKQIHAFAHLDPEHALAQARALDERRASGRPLGPLHGVPVAIKDIVDTSDYPTECGSAVLSGRRPFKDATVVARLRTAGAVIIGKTVTTEFAYFHPGATRNPHDLERTPGGSSSGSAAAVAAGMVPLAIGSQTNGSIIRPGAFCGVFAAKPTHGLVSRAGVLTLSRTLDHIGPFARSLEDIALVLSAIAGYDPQDPDTRPVATADFPKTASEKWPLTPRLAFVRTPMWDKADATTRAAFESIAEQLGAACIAVDLPDRFAVTWEAIRTIMAADMAHNLGAVVDKGGDAVSKRMRDLVEEGRKVSAAQYLRALEQGRALRAALDEVFEECNAIVTPASRGVAPKGLDSTGDPAFCSLWSLTGLPALTLPLLSGDDDMPLGVQLVGPAGDDARLLRTANWLVNTAGGKASRRRAKA